ncbi:MAG: ATP-binding protein [Pseudomonadota bacterium]
MTAVLRSLGLDSRLAFKLVIASLIVGSVLSIIATALQLGASYVRQRGEATAILDRIEQTQAKSLERAVWTFNAAQVDIILDGVITDTNVGYVALTSELGQSWERGTQPSDDPDLVRAYTLQHVFDDGRTEPVATLEVHLTLASVRDRVWAQFWATFITNLVKAYIAALALLYLVHYLITRHLNKIADYVSAQKASDSSDLQLDRTQTGKPDDLDKIVDAIAHFERRTSRQVKHLVTEVEEREKAENEAKRALSVRSQFLATMSHEVRTPLNAIIGFLHLIENHANVPDKPKLYAATATKAAHQLLTQLNNTLDMSRLEANAVEIVRLETDLKTIAHTWVETARATAATHERDIEVTLNIAPECPNKVMIDGPHVSQIVGNLTDNAIKFTNSGKVEIALSQPEAGFLDIMVSDTGEGVPEHARQNIFGRFQQAEGGLLRAHGGTGLGLAISNELARLMDAELTLCETERDGFSTTFLLRLRT